MELLQNKVAASGLITLDLEKFYPETTVISFDLKDFLFMEMLLKEKEFRASLEEHDWWQYDGKFVAVFCSTDAIIPLWAYMLVSAKLSPHAKKVHAGDAASFFRELFLQNIRSGIIPADYVDKRVVIKGCGEKPIPEYAYMEASLILLPVVRSLMYGEPCSTVPVFKQK